MAPRIFTKIVSQVSALIREKDILFMAFFDDFLLVAPSLPDLSYPDIPKDDVTRGLDYKCERAAVERSWKHGERTIGPFQLNLQSHSPDLVVTVEDSEPQCQSSLEVLPIIITTDATPLDWGLI